MELKELIMEAVHANVPYLDKSRMHHDTSEATQSIATNRAALAAKIREQRRQRDIHRKYNNNFDQRMANRDDNYARALSLTSGGKFNQPGTVVSSNPSAHSGEYLNTIGRTQDVARQVLPGASNKEINQDLGHDKMFERPRVVPTHTVAFDNRGNYKTY